MCEIENVLTFQLNPNKSESTGDFWWRFLSAASEVFCRQITVVFASEDFGYSSGFVSIF